MKRLFFQRALALVLTLMLVIGSVPAGASAVEPRYNDTSGHWAASAIDQWSDYGVLNGHAGSFRPGDPITRAEMAAVLTKVIGYAAVGQNRFSDVDSGKWYYEYVLKLAAAGIMVGADGKARPQDSITREEAATLFARAFSIPEITDDPQPFKDAGRISAWAAGYVGGLHTAGYIDGKPVGNFDPGSNITRAEVVTILDNIVNAFYRLAGEHTGNASGNALVNAAGVTLRNMHISGNLYLTEGIGLGNAVLNEITVAKTTYIRGGGSDSVTVTGGDLGAVELDSRTNTHLVFSTDTLVSKITIRNTGKVTRGSAAVTFDAATGLLELSGTFDKAVLNADGTVAVTAQGVLYEIIPPGGGRLKLTLTAGSVIKEMELYAALSLTGTGQIDRLTIHASGSEVDGGVKIELKSITLDDGLTVTINHLIYTGTGGAIKLGTAAGGTGGGGGSGGGGSGGGSGKEAVTVTFYTDGGSRIAPIQIARGKTLSAIPMPVKADYAFIGWYTDQALTQAFYSELPIERDLTLYAGYRQRSSGMKVYTDPNKYIEDCPANYTVKIDSAAALTNGNLSLYVELTAYTGDTPKLQVTGNNGVYTLSSLEPYTPGVMYELTLLREELSFSEEEAAVRKLSFRIHQDRTEIIKMNDDLVYVLWPEVTDLGEGAYQVSADKYTIKTGDVVCLWDGVYNSRTKYRNVVQSTLQAGEGGSGPVILLNTEASRVEDVFDELDIYIEQGIPLEEYLDQIDTKKIARDAKNSPGTRQLTAVLNQALAESPTILALASKDEYFLTPSESAQKEVIPVDIMFSGIDDLDVTCTVGGTDNANFPHALNPETVAEWGGNDYSPVLTLTFNYSTTINNVQVDAAITIKEYLTASLQGWGKLTFINGVVFDNLAFDYAVNMYAQTNINMSVSVKSTAASEYEYDFDVTEEINKLIQGNQDEDSDDPAAILKAVLGDKGDYIELVEASIMDIPLQIVPKLPVAEVHIRLDFVVKANFAAGISSDMTLLSARQVGIAGNVKGGQLKTYNNELLGNNRYALDLYAAGYVGCKTGLKGTITISFIGLEDLARLGTSLELGGYADLYGFAKASIVKTYPNNYVHSGKRLASLTGAIYLDLGLYLEQELFAESELFSARASFTPVDLKFSLLNFGDRYVLSKFLNNEQRILMNTESLPLNDSNGLLSAEFIDITTGEKITGSFADPAKFYIQYASPYFSTQNNAITVNKSLLGPDVKRLDTTVYIYYDGGALTFTGPKEIFYDINNKPVSFDTPKTVKLTWIDSSIDPAQVSDIDTVKATYVASIDGKETVLAQKTVLLGEIPGSVDLFDYTDRYKIVGYANDFNEAIEKDTVYKIYMTPYQRLVSFITYYDEQWHFAVFPVNSNESPIPPAKYNASAPNFNFSRWFINSGYWGYTKGNVYSPVPIPMGNGLAYGIGNVFTGLDSTKPLFSVSGTLNDCYDAYYKQTYDGKTFSSLSLACYVAEYQKKNYTITIEYPAMEYTVYGNPVRQGHSAWDRTFAHGDPIVISGADLIVYNGCEMLGWDTNGDGIVDYDPLNPPAATRDMTFSAVMKIKTFEVTVQDYAGETAEVLTVNIGNLPDILSTRPAHPGGEGYEFLGWQIFKAGGGTVVWDPATDPGVYENWTIRPVYTHYNTVSFIFYTNGIPSTSIVYLPAGTYPVSDYIFITPSRPADERNAYTFTGWDCGDTFTVTGDMTINALFSETPIVYTLNFTTPYGQLTTGGTAYTISSTYAEYAGAAAAFIADNREFEPAAADGRMYTFLNWNLTDVDNVNHVFGYTAVWRAEAQNYTVTFNGGDGYYQNTDTKTWTASYPENTLAYLLDTDSFIKPEDDSSTYILAGWRDPDHNFYNPGAPYTVNKDLTFTAEYAVLMQKTYTVRFDAAGGEFPGGGSFIESSYYYNDVITDPPVPTKASDEVYSYTFEGWEPEIAPVTANTTYTAQYQRSSDAVLPAGIKISDGTTTEDINLQTVPGYTYAMEMNYYGEFVPTLKITGNGLTVSGVLDDPFEKVRIFIAPAVTDIRFDDLTLSIANDNLIYAAGESISGELTITISGLCRFDNYGSYSFGGYRYSFAPIESERELKLQGEDAAAELRLNTDGGASGIICGASAVTQDLNLTVNMVITEELVGVLDNWGRLPAAFHNGKYSGSNWSFIDSKVTVDTDGRGFGNSGFGSIGDIEVTRSDFSITCAYSYIDKAASLSIADSIFNVSGKSRLDYRGRVLEIGDTDGIVTGAVTIRDNATVNLAGDAIAQAELLAGSLNFEDFSGTFAAYCLDESVTRPAVLSEGAIKFLEQGAELPDPASGYGVYIGPVSVGGTDYYTFVDGADSVIPLAAVSF